MATVGFYMLVFAGVCVLAVVFYYWWEQWGHHPEFWWQVGILGWLAVAAGLLIAGS